MVEYDIGVIGGGPAGTSIAYQMVADGKSVAIFEDYLWGGTCPNYGCDPKKIIVNSVDVLYQTKLFKDVLNGEVTLNWPNVMAKKQAYVDNIPEKTKDGLKSMGIKTYDKTPQFINEDTVLLDDDTQIRAKKWIIATGKRPIKPTFEGSEYAISSEDFLNLKQMPRDITFIGGGYISIEFASIARLTGARVKVLQHNDQILKQFEPKMVDELTKRLTDQGIEFCFNTEVLGLQKNENEITVTTNQGEFKTSCVIYALGRKPSVDGLNLDVANVELNKNGIIVDKNLKTTNEKIYAIGDVADTNTPNLTSVAGYEANYLGKYLTHKIDGSIKYPAIPSAVFSHPRIAQVGIDTKTAQQKGYQVKEYDLKDWFNYMRQNDDAKITVISKKGKIVGVSLLSNQADEILNIFVNAINEELRIDDVKKQIAVYPTMESDLKYFY